MSKTPHRKNYIMTFILTVALWAMWISVFFTLPPLSIYSYILFLVLLFSAITLTSALVFGNTRLGILLSMGFIGLLVLYQFEQLNPVNGILFISLLATSEYYLKQKSK